MLFDKIDCVQVIENKSKSHIVVDFKGLCSVILKEYFICRISRCKTKINKIENENVQKSIG